MQGKRIWRVDKKLDDLKGSKVYDLIDGMGVTWEVKADRLWHVTGTVYVELQALRDSEADNSQWSVRRRDSAVGTGPGASSPDPSR